MMLQQAHHLRYSMLTTYRDYPSSRSSSIWFHRRGPWSAGCSHSRFQVGASLDPAPESLALTFFGVVGAPAQSDVVLRCAALLLAVGHWLGVSGVVQVGGSMFLAPSCIQRLSSFPLLPLEILSYIFTAYPSLIHRRHAFASCPRCCCCDTPLSCSFYFLCPIIPLIFTMPGKEM